MSQASMSLVDGPGPPRTEIGETIFVGEKKSFQRALIFLGDKDCFADLGLRVELKGKSKASRNLQVIQRLIEIRCDPQRSS